MFDQTDQNSIVKRKILYIFPHPDDESFGPAPAMHKQVRTGHQVSLLTLTKGGATKQRLKYGYSVEEMGDIRYKEMLNVARVLNLSNMTVLDLPDSGLKEMDPREIEKNVRDEIEKLQPDIIVTYPVHGISGFHDHLVSHAVVKRVYLHMKESGASFLKRLAFFTLREQDKPKDGVFQLHHSTIDEIDCIVTVNEEDGDKGRMALDCYKSYADVIEKTRIKDLIGNQVAYEFFQENFSPPIGELGGNLR